MQIIFPNSCKYFMHAGGVDMRKGFDGLSGLVLQSMQKQPLDGSIYIFLNKHRNRMKLLHSLAGRWFCTLL